MGTPATGRSGRCAPRPGQNATGEHAHHDVLGKAGQIRAVAEGLLTRVRPALPVRAGSWRSRAENPRVPERRDRVAWAAPVPAAGASRRPRQRRSKQTSRAGIPQWETPSMGPLELPARAGGGVRKSGQDIVAQDKQAGGQLDAPGRHQQGVVQAVDQR